MISRTRIFALIDVNNCYVSCEQVFNPRLNNRAVVVLSNNDGCVIARSPQAKALGIKMAVPVFQIKALIAQHQVMVLSSNYALYAEMSRRFMNILASFVDPVDQEIYSIDECFLELTAYQQLYDLQEYAKQILATVKQYLGLPCCIGIGYSKTQAKLANHFAKKYASFAGVCSFIEQDPCVLEDLLQQTSVAEVWGVGRKLAQSLEKIQIRSVMDLLLADAKALRRLFSVQMEDTIRELNGTACIELDDGEQPQQQIVSSRSFGQAIDAYPSLSAALSEFCLRAVQRLRQQKLLCKCIGIHLRYHRTAQHAGSDPYTVVYLADYSDDLLGIHQAVQAGLKRIFREGHRYKKAGIMLLDLIPQQHYCPDLFGDMQQGRRRQQLAQALEQISQQYGKDSLRPATVLSHAQQQQWRMKQNFKSPNYLTRWNELLVVS